MNAKKLNIFFYFSLPRPNPQKNAEQEARSTGAEPWAYRSSRAPDRRIWNLLVTGYIISSIFLVSPAASSTSESFEKTLESTISRVLDARGLPVTSTPLCEVLNGSEGSVIKDLSTTKENIALIQTSLNSVASEIGIVKNLLQTIQSKNLVASTSLAREIAAGKEMQKGFFIETFAFLQGNKQLATSVASTVLQEAIAKSYSSPFSPPYPHKPQHGLDIQTVKTHCRENPEGCGSGTCRICDDLNPPEEAENDV